MTKKARPTVYELSRPSRCHNCDKKLEVGELVKLADVENEREALCRSCSGLDKFEIVPVGNAALTRLASKYSEECYTIMRWSELWKCYERKGVLVQPPALSKARGELKL